MPPSKRVGLLVGEHQRRGQPDGVGPHGVDQEARLRAAASTAGGDRLRSRTSARHSPRPRGPASSGWSIGLEPGAQLLAEPLRVREQAVGLDGVEDGERRRRRDRVAAERGAVDRPG